MAKGFNERDRYWEVTVQIHPTIFSMGGYGPSTTSSSLITEGVRRLFLDSSSKCALIKKIGCVDYTVLEDRLCCSHVIVVLKFHSEPAMKTFEESFYSDQLAKKLEQYCMSVGLHMDLGYSYRFTNREFRFKITIERQCIIQTKTMEQDSFRSSAGALDSNMQGNEVRKVLFKLYIPGDKTKVLNVAMHIDVGKVSDKMELKNISGSNLWGITLNIPCGEQIIKYYYCIEFDSTIQFNFGFLGKFRFLEKSKEFRTVTFSSRGESSAEIQLAFCEEVEDGYFSLCFDILKSSESGKELEYMTQMKEMEEISSFLMDNQKDSVLKRMRQGMQEERLTLPVNCAVFVSFLLHASTNFRLGDILPCGFAKTIIDGCSSLNIECIPKAQKDGFIIMLEKVYKCADGENANILSFCDYMYPRFDADICCKLLSNWRSSQKNPLDLLHKDEKNAGNTLKSLVDKICQQWGSPKELRFLEKVQRCLSLDFQIEIMKLVFNKIGSVDASIEILQSTFERKLLEMSKNGEIVDISNLWDRILLCPFLNTDVMRSKTEKYLLESLDKAREPQLKKAFDKLEELCRFSTLFLEKDSKLSLLRKFATSMDVDIHSLVALCLKEKSYHDIPRDEVENIVLTWFDHASEHHCGKVFKGHTVSDSLLRLYSYVGKIISNEWLQSHDSLLKKLEQKAFEYLKGVDTIDILKAVPKVEKLDNEPIEDLFSDHIQALFKEGIENGDIIREDLFEHTKTLQVNSNVALHHFSTLMECSGLKEEMEIEEAFEILLSTPALWISIFSATGNKRDELWKEKLYIKAKRTILEIRDAFENKKIKVSFFRNLQEKRELCLEYFSLFQEKKMENGEVEWLQISNKMQNMTKNLEIAVGVFNQTKHKMEISQKTDCIDFCLKFLRERHQQVIQGNISVMEMDDLFSHHSLLDEMWNGCRSMEDVVVSEVFWNISKKFFHEFDASTDFEEDQDDIFSGIAALFEESKVETDDSTAKNLHIGCNVLRYLFTTIQRYREFWNPLLSGKDVSMSVLQNVLENADIIHELTTAETICHCKASNRVRRALHMYNEFEQQSEKVHLMKNVLKAFRVNIMQDDCFQRALSEYEKLLKGEIDEMTLFHIEKSLDLVGKVVGVVDSNMFAILQELQKSSLLIDFLMTVVDEDIRNLIDAVEEHSEQFVRESTVSDLIEVKRFMQPLLKQKYDDNIQKFFNAMNKSLETSGIKNVDRKIYECSSNLHSLKALYNHVANRGEHTKEIIENIVKRGVFHFSLKEKECEVSVEYKQDKKTHSYSKSYLNDLRSRALLILNAEEKQQEKLQTTQNKKEHLNPFIEIVDVALDVGHMCVLLKGAGHFQYAYFEQKRRKDALQDLLVELKSKYKEWCKVLGECRRRFYLMNYIHSDQLQLLYNYTKTGENKESVITILKFINPELSDFEDILYTLKQKNEDSCPERNLEALGHALECIGKSLVPTPEIMFDRKPNSKLSQIVQPGRLYITALEPDSQLVVRTLLALHWHTNQNIPFAHNILLCNRNTSMDELTLHLNRCFGCENEQLFTIANIEMLTPETQDYLVESLKNIQSHTLFHLALLFRGNRHHTFHEKFSDLLMRPKPITENELREFLTKKYPHVLTVTSAVPGLGKSEEIQRLALQNDKGKITLHISGIFDRENIVEELISLEIKPFHVLHIDIGPINEPFELDAFLFELIVLKHVSVRKFAFHLETDFICIEIANSVNQELSNSLPTVTCFNRKNLVWNNYSNMHVSQEVNSPVQVVCHYLNLQDSGKLDQTDLYLTGDKRVSPLPTHVCRNLLQKHFSTAGDMSYTIVNIFLGVLADQLKKLSSSVFFRTSNIQQQLVKSELVNALKNMSIDFSSRSINACRSTQTASMSVMSSSQNATHDFPLTCAEVLAKRTESMIRWEDSNHLMVLFHHDLQTVSALYRDKDKVPQQISKLFEDQLKKKLENFGAKCQEELKSILVKLVQHPSKIDENALNEMTKQYALTPDNLLKMVLIVLRIQGHQPVIIMGETGCGKTSLIRYLSTICQIDFHILSIHAGVTEEMIVKRVNASDNKAKKNFKRCVWLFLDEINTCDHLGLICDVICHHHCKGKRLAPNLKIIAACNPYRLRPEKSILTSGLQGKIKTDHLSKLVYRVHPLPETMIDYVWDYGSLQKQDEKSYIERMVQGMFQRERFVKLFLHLLIMSQQFVKDEEGSECCVSLRDVERCRRLVVWFVKILKKKEKVYRPNKIESNAIILALSICYHSRFPDNYVRKKYREKIAICCEKMTEQDLNTEEKIEKIIVDEQNDILNRMELPLGIAKNTALRENVFVILVCILNRIPVFVVGKPGCSKSLSMQLIRSNLRGKDSCDSFFKSLPQLYCVSFQGSESSTSDGIIKVFEKAQNYQNHNKSEDVLSVVILDEIGLAEISRFNPLKVLHSLLEPENQATPDVSVVGISNWALDSAKMNRAIHLSRPEMDEKELYQTSLSITESLMGQSFTTPTLKFSVRRQDKAGKMTAEIKQLLKKLADAFWTYNKNQKYKNFHGLRDFYSLTKYIGKGILYDNKTEQIDDVIIRGLLRNLGGLSKELRKLMMSDFHECIHTDDTIDIGVLDLIQNNLMDRQSRHLMLITNGDAVLSVLEDKVKEMDRQHVVIFGSLFEEDLTDDYNYRILSRIILCMEQGFVLILKDLENIYGSLYDMLNQNYTVVGSKKNCRVALGPYSNPMCHVHEDFKCIVLVEESKLDYSDPPFLNRFEKQQFRFEDMMSTKAINIRDSLVKFSSDICEIDGCSYKPENVFALSGENLFSSLVLKVQKEMTDEKQIIQNCQRQLLWITAPEAMIRIRDTILWEKQPNTARKLEKEYFDLPIHKGLQTLLEFLNSSRCHENVDLKESTSDTSLVVIFTHDNELQSLPIQSSSIKMERLRNFKSEKQLNQKVQDFFASDSNQFLLYCNAAEDFGLILLAKSIIENCKRSVKEVLLPKSMCIICHLDRQGFKHEPLNQINFLSGWKLAMLDKLYEPKTPLPQMMSLTVEKVLESRRPMVATIQNHIFWAFTTIQYIGTGQSAEKMLKKVCDLKESDYCLSVLEDLVFDSIYTTHKTISKNWQVNVAHDEHALVQSSCYMNALEQYLLNQIKNPLCKIIFRLEEANAFDCVFIKDDCQEKRLTLWRNLIMKDSLMDFSDIPDPFGPECYTCSSERLCMKLPFSYIVLCRVEKIKDDFLNTIRQLKISCDLAEDDEIPTSMLTELVGKYNDIVEQNLTEYIEDDYTEKFREYQHDFYLMMSSQHNGVLDEEEKIKVMKWAQTLFDTEEFQHDFALKVTNIHILHWVYSSVLNSITKVMDVVKEHTNVSTESFFCEMSNEPVITSELKGIETQRDMFVDKLCRIFLPTTNFMIQIPSVQKWQFLVSSVLPFFAEISLNPSSIHMVRFCSDVAQALLSIDREAAVHILSTFGDALWNGTDLECSEMFDTVMTQVKVLKETKNVGVENLHHFLCQYLSRSIAINQEQNASFICYLTSISADSVLDRKLHYLGPILEIIVDMENENGILVDLIDMNLEELDTEGYLHYINQCIKSTDEDADSILSSLLVSTLQNIYRENVNEEILDTVEGSSHEIFKWSFRASAVLQKQKECSLNLVASIAYIQNLIHAYIALLDKNSMNADALPIITKTLNALMETGVEENGFEAQRIQCVLVYFLKCLSSIEEDSELRKKMISLENSLPVLKSLDLKDDFMTRSVTFDPLFMYRTADDKNLEIVFLSLEKTEKKKLQEIAEQATTDSRDMLVFAGLIANTFYFKSQQKETNDTTKAVSVLIFEMMQTKLPKIQTRVIEVLLKNSDFSHPLFNIDTETRSCDIQIVSVLVHLLCLIVFKGEIGNCWHDIFTDVSKIKTKFLPGNSVKQIELSCQACIHFCNDCKIRFVRSESECPSCHKKCNTNVTCKKETEMRKNAGYEKPTEELLTSSELLSPVTCHLLQFLIHGCVLLAYAIGIVDSGQLQYLLGVEEEPGDILTNILEMKWKYLKSLTQLNNEDLSTFIHVVIYESKDLLTQRNAPYNCQTEVDCKHVEVKLQATLQNMCLEKYRCIGNARLSLKKRYDIDPHSLECQIHEVCVIEGTQDRRLMLPRLFRITRTASKEGLVAQVFINDKIKFPLLRLILTKEDILTLPKFILPILRWHHSTVSIGSYKMKKVDCKTETIEKFLRMETDDTRRRLLKKRFEEFKTSWNELLKKKSHLFMFPLENEDTLSNNSKVVKCIITDDNSIIQKVLMELVQIHNLFIDSCLQFAVTSDVPSLHFLMTSERLSRVKATSLWELTSKDIIKFSTLNEEILRYSQCKSDFGEGQDRCYDLQKIENELAHDLILEKPFIFVPSTFPRILFVDELFQNTIQLLENIRKTIPQEKLPHMVLKSILKKNDNDSSQIVELMTILGMSLSLLKKTKGDPTLPLTEYLEGWKDIAVFPKGYKRLLPEPEDVVKLCHVVNLYVKLEELNGESILDTLDLKYRDDLPPEGKGQLETIGGSYVHHLEVLEEALKVFIHRCLAVQDNTVSVDQELIDYLKDEDFWPQGNLKNGYVSAGGHKKKLAEILCCAICVKHIYNTINFIDDFIQEKREMEHKISSISASYLAAESPSKSVTKRKTIRKKMGKT